MEIILNMYMSNFNELHTVRLITKPCRFYYSVHRSLQNYTVVENIKSAPKMWNNYGVI